MCLTSSFLLSFYQPKRGHLLIKYNARPRVCNLGYLRMPYVQPNGKIGYRCPSEPVDEWIKKGGDVEATKGRKCLCNSLCANVGLPQIRSIKEGDGKKRNYVEDILITIGNEVNDCKRFMKKDEQGNWSYRASDVVDYLLSEWKLQQAQKEVKDAVLSGSKKENPAFVNFSRDEKG
eukprot:45153_1